MKYSIVGTLMFLSALAFFTYMCVLSVGLPGLIIGSVIALYAARPIKDGDRWMWQKKIITEKEDETDMSIYCEDCCEERNSVETIPDPLRLSEVATLCHGCWKDRVAKAEERDFPMPLDDK